MSSFRAWALAQLESDAARAAVDAKAPIEEFFRASNPHPLSEGVFLRFDLPPESVSSLTDEIIARFTELNDAVAASVGAPSWAATMEPFVLASQALSPLVSSVTFLGHVHPGKAVRDAATEAETRLDAFSVQQSMRLDVFAAIKAFAATEPQLRPEEQRLLERRLRDCRRCGLDLEDEEKRAAVEEIARKMGEISIQFAKNLGEEDGKLAFTKEELDGVPADVVDGLDATEDGKKLVLTLKYPHVLPTLKFCRVPATRAACEKAFNSRCKEENTPLLEELVRLRAEKARLLGYATHAHFVLETRMAKTPETVIAFLEELSAKLDTLADADRAVLLKLKAEELGADAPDAGVLHPFDLNYYQEMRRQREFGVDANLIKQFFPTEFVVDRVLELYQDILGVTFDQIEDAHTWEETVRAFRVTDTSSGAFIGVFYMDLYPRLGKYGHAACFGLQAGCRDGEDSRQAPVAACVCNFPRSTPERPSTIPHTDVVTLLHEFGHVMHQVLSKAEFETFAGTAVERDFVEAPSQMLENWGYEAEVLARLSQHVETKEPLPEEHVRKLVAAKNANAGLFNKRQLVFGLFDQTIHSRAEADVTALFAESLLKQMKVKATEGTAFPASFGHLAGGYDAQYYGYLWSEVFALDMYDTRFRNGAGGVLSKETGQVYRRSILEPGGSRDAKDMLVDFLGREPNQKAFLKEKGLLLLE